LGLSNWLGARDPERISLAEGPGVVRDYRLATGATVELGGAGGDRSRDYPLAGTSRPVARLRRGGKGIQLEPTALRAAPDAVLLNGKPLKSPATIETGDVITFRIPGANRSAPPREVNVGFGTPLRHRLPAAPWLRSFLASLVDVSRSLAAAGIGAFVASLIRDRNILLPATVFAAFADYLMVYTSIGTVNKALQTEQGQRVIRSMSAHVATAHPSIAAPTVGMADYVFLALFFACVYRFGMNERATFTAFFVALGLSLFFVLTGHALPALVPMGLAFVAANFRHFRLSRSELQAMGLAFGIVVVVVIGLFLFRR
jgi:hypothetical protein